MDKGYITYHLFYRLLDHGKPYLWLKGMTESYQKILDFEMDGILGCLSWGGVKYILCELRSVCEWADCGRVC